MRASKQRDAILAVLDASYDHPTAETVYEKVRETIPNISLGTVYRNLSALVDDGRVRAIECGEGKVRYDGHLEEHQHFVCRVCGRLFDVFVSTSVPEDILSRDFCVEKCETVFYGVCSECRKNK